MFKYHVINLKIFISKINFFQQRCDNHIHMEDDKHN
jgi:hypothetical protein